jgi:ribosomal protein S8
MKIDKQFTRIFEDEDVIETWTYNPDITNRGPISVDIKYKVGAEKRIKQRAKDTKQEKKTARQMKKINNRNK